MLCTLLSFIFFFIALWFFYHSYLFDKFCSIIIGRSKHYRALQRPKRIILIRHGQSQGNEDTSIYCSTPDHAIGLTTEGRKQALKCGEELNKIIGNETLVCFVSPFRRSKETCELICRSFSSEKILRVREDPRIREQEWGNFQDLTTRETVVAERKKIGRFFYRFKDGESGADVYDRVSSFMDSLYREMDHCLLPDNNVLIVSHGLFMRLFLMRFYRWTVEKFHTLENFDNCAYCILERDNQDGSFILQTELKTYPEETTHNHRLSTLAHTFSDKSFDEEVHPSITTDDIKQHDKKID